MPHIRENIDQNEKITFKLISIFSFKWRNVIVQQIVIRILHTNMRDNNTLPTDQDTLRFSAFPFHNVEIMSDYAYVIFIPFQFPRAIADRGRDSGVQSVIEC